MLTVSGPVGQIDMISPLASDAVQANMRDEEILDLDSTGVTLDMKNGKTTAVTCSWTAQSRSALAAVPDCRSSSIFFQHLHLLLEYGPLLLFPNYPSCF
jgi:hypothetical protein